MLFKFSFKEFKSEENPFMLTNETEATSDLYSNSSVINKTNSNLPNSSKLTFSAMPVFKSQIINADVIILIWIIGLFVEEIRQVNQF
jgi:hypothetical protein